MITIMMPATRKCRPDVGKMFIGLPAFDDLAEVEFVDASPPQRP